MGYHLMLTLMFVFFTAVLLAGCGSSGRATPTPSGPDFDFTGGLKRLDEDKAVDLVQRYVSSSGGSVVVRVHYWETTERKVTCHGDPEYQGCYEDPFSPTGYSKDIKRQERVCCRSEQKRLPDRVSWEAVYEESADEWIVKADFSMDDVDQLITWIVDDNSEEVSHSR
jgi:hypothetical protein